MSNKIFLWGIIDRLSHVETRAKALKMLATIWDTLDDKTKLKIANAAMEKVKGTTNAGDS